MNHTTRIVSARALLGVAALSLLAGAKALSDPAQPVQEDVEEAVETARSALEKWVETRQVISKEKRDWALGKELLTERIELLGDEIETIRESTRSAEATIGDADEKRAELLAEKERMVEVAGGMTAAVAGLEARMTALLTKLPDPVRAQVKPLSQRFPEAGAESEQSLGQRFQNVVGVLNSIDRFHREVSTNSEVRELPGGASVEVTTVYFGVSQGYYASADGRHAGTGRATESGWTWTPLDRAAPEILRAIAILQNEVAAEFVPLPVQID